MYRPQIKVLDCTIRDGGLMNDSKFKLEEVQAVYKAVCDAGVDYIELGYRNSKKHFSPKEYGPWRFCDESMLRKVVGDEKNEHTKISIMQDAHKAIAEDIIPRSESVVDMVRVATYVKDIDKAIKLANNAKEKGYETTINIMAITHAIERHLGEALQQIEAETNCDIVYIVDSFGSMYSEDIEYMVEKYRRSLPTKELGIHCHNHQQLGYANTITAIIKNVNYLDGSLFGLGRAAGNTPIELLLSFLKNPKFDVRPILDVIAKTILPMQEKLEWGYCIPYMIAGTLNVHPQDAMSVMGLSKDDPRRFDYVKLYEEMSYMSKT